MGQMKNGAIEQGEPAAAAPTTEELTRETLSGDLRDRFLERVRSLAKPWQQMTEGEQTTLNYEIERMCADVVHRAVKMIAADGRQAIVATCESVTFKDGIKAVLSMAKSDELRHALADAQGDTALVIVTNSDAYIGEQAPAQVDGAQPPLPLGDDGPIFDRTAAGQA